MKITTITLGDEAVPDTVTAIMTTAEAALIAAVLGGLSPKEVTDQFGGSHHLQLESIYGALSGDFFNRFWDGGVRDVISSCKTKLEAG